MSLADHVIILREWLQEVAERHQPRIIVMVGFSLGAEMGFELPIESPWMRHTGKGIQIGAKRRPIFCSHDALAIYEKFTYKPLAMKFLEVAT